MKIFSKIVFNGMPIVTTAIVVAFLFYCIPLNAETVEDVAKKINSPEELEKFYANGFAGEYKIPDYTKSPQETLDTKRGDCKDFAILNKAILNEMGIPSEVVYIKFFENKFGHAICIWKKGGYYNYFDGAELIKTKHTSMQAVMNNSYLNMECCTACKKKLDMETGRCKE